MTRMLLPWVACLAAALSLQGFKLDPHESCGGNLTGQSGELNSSGFGPENDCVWLINKEGSVRVELTLLFLNVRQTLDCSTDYLEVIDGPRLNGTVLMRVCGSHLPENSTVASLASAMTVRLKSNERDHDNSFRASYTSVAKMPADTPTSQVVRRTKRAADITDPGCSTSHHIRESGTFVYHFPATPRKDCTWTLTTDLKDHHFVLNSAEIIGKTERRVNCALEPHVDVFEGGQGKLSDTPLERICGRGDKPIGSTTSSLVMRLDTQNVTDGKFVTKFSLHPSGSGAVAITAAIASGVCLLVVAVGVGLWWRKRTAKTALYPDEDSREPFVNGALEDIDEHRTLSEMASFLPYEPSFEIQTGKVKMYEIIGQGAFGVVKRGQIYGIVPGKPPTTVAVKTVHRHAKNLYAKKALISELKILVHLGQHLNVVNMVGANTSDLSNFIDEIDVATGAFHPSRDLSSSEKHRDCCTSDLFRYAYQAARGMEYLTSRNVVHGDLAARNVLLADQNIVKIGDFGMSMLVQQDLNSDAENESPICLPYKWVAIETFIEGTFSKESDVWSYGVFVWELFSLAQTPYKEIPIGNLLGKLTEGYRLEKPRYATNDVYNVMTDCWNEVPGERPTFTKLAETLSPMINDADHLLYTQKNGLYVDMNKERQKNPGYYDYLQMFSTAPSYTMSKPPIYVYTPTCSVPAMPTPACYTPTE